VSKPWDSDKRAQALSDVVITEDAWRWTPRTLDFSSAGVFEGELGSAAMEIFGLDMTN
jgi:hypothetical protein